MRGAGCHSAGALPGAAADSNVDSNVWPQGGVHTLGQKPLTRGGGPRRTIGVDLISRQQPRPEASRLVA